jgi:hypothetical protein
MMRLCRASGIRRILPARLGCDDLRRVRVGAVAEDRRARKLQVGDRFTTESGEREVIGRPYSSAGGKMVHARVQYIDQPATAVVWLWGAHERVSVKR